MAIRQRWPATKTCTFDIWAYDVSWELVIFDCDGVLVDSEPISNRVMAEVLAESGLTVTLDDCYRHFMGRSTKDCIRILAERFNHSVSPDFTGALRRRTLAALRDEVEQVPGIASILERIAWPTCVASNGPIEKMRTTLRATGLLDHFGDRLFSGADVARGKPHPDLFLHAATRSGVEPSVCAVVEDSPVGVEAGIAAGMTVFGYAALTDGARLEQAGAHVFTHMRQLPALLERGPPS